MLGHYAYLGITADPTVYFDDFFSKKRVLAGAGTGSAKEGVFAQDLDCGIVNKHATIRKLSINSSWSM